MIHFGALARIRWCTGNNASLLHPLNLGRGKFEKKNSRENDIVALQDILAILNPNESESESENEINLNEIGNNDQQTQRNRNTLAVTMKDMCNLLRFPTTYFLVFVYTMARLDTMLLLWI